MELKKRLPSDRSFEQIRNHYLVEKSIADRLKIASREERKHIFSTMYDEVFMRVPDHPRLTIRRSDQLSETASRRKLSAVRKLLNKSLVFMEFAPGDCRFSCEAAKHVQHVYGIDISDQRDPNHAMPENFTLVVYDGYHLDEIKNESVDVIFSDQLIEHLHESDTRLHFELAHRVLKSGGQYMFRTPHFLTGPHDISQFFSYEPEGFHLKEWTYAEIETLLTELGYSRLDTYWSGKGINIQLPRVYFSLCEIILGKISKRYVRQLTKYLLPSLCVSATK